MKMEDNFKMGRFRKNWLKLIPKGLCLRKKNRQAEVLLDCPRHTAPQCKGKRWIQGSKLLPQNSYVQDGTCRACWQFKGGWINDDGYRVVGQTKKGGPLLEHRYVMEKKLGRKLKTVENIHHKNGNRSDNRIRNLDIKLKSKHGAGIGVQDAVEWLRSLGWKVSK